MTDHDDALAEVAARRGWRLTASDPELALLPVPWSTFDDDAPSSVGDRQHGVSAVDVLTGTFASAAGDLPFQAYTRRSVSHSVTTAQGGTRGGVRHDRAAVVRVRLPRADGDLTVTPNPLSRRVLGLLGMRFFGTGDARFDAAYSLGTADRDFAARLLTPEVVAWQLAQPGSLHWRVFHGHLEQWRLPAQISTCAEDLVDQVGGLVALLPASVISAA